MAFDVRASNGRAGITQRSLDISHFRELDSARNHYSARPDYTQQIQRQLDDRLGADIGGDQID